LRLLHDYILTAITLPLVLNANGFE